jgi:anti-sigma regulatory factor (Ser/Thr protein kinase)
LQLVCEVRDETQVGAARRQARQVAVAAGLNEVMTEHTAIVATELASNVWKHAGGGCLLIQEISDASFDGVELLAVDRGPGMQDIGRSLQDGHSTSGTPGTGLGAARRLSAVFDVHSEPGKGTVVVSRIGTHHGQQSVFPSWGAVMTSAPGESVCGDLWSMALSNGGVLTIMVVDGLGHGVLAHAVAQHAVRTFAAHHQSPPGVCLQRLHAALSGGRGAAVAVAQADLASGAMTYAGAGNVAGMIVQANGRQTGLVSMNGTVGADHLTVREFQYQWDPGDVLVMHSDGLRSHWSLNERAGLLHRHPAIISAVLHRDFLRGRDDATVVALIR